MRSAPRQALQVVRFVWSHPANSHCRGSAVQRAIAWQLKSRLLRKSVTVTLGLTSQVRVHPRHCEVESNIVYARLPDWQEMLVWQRYLRAGDLFVDVGACVGTYALWACELGAHAVAIEPGSYALARLRENVLVNSYPIEVIPAAAGEVKGIGVTMLGGPYPMQIRETIPGVPVVTIDDILGDRTAAGMKVDVEGAEILVLRGASSALAQGRIHLIQLEWNDCSKSLLGQDRSPIVDLLSDAGYAFFRPDLHGELQPVSDATPFGPDIFAKLPD